MSFIFWVGYRPPLFKGRKTECLCRVLKLPHMPKRNFFNTWQSSLSLNLKIVSRRDICWHTWYLEFIEHFYKFKTNLGGIFRKTTDCQWTKHQLQWLNVYSFNKYYGISVIRNAYLEIKDRTMNKTMSLFARK
jgi:hypothetical protein